MGHEITEKDHRLQVRLDADLDVAGAEALREALADAIGQDTARVTFDLNAVDHLSGAALALFSIVFARLGKKPSSVVLIGVPPNLLRVFTTLGLDQEYTLAFRPA